MIPHKTKRGQAALKRLRVYDGIPPPFDKKRRVCVPIAMKVLCLRSDRKFCQIGRLSHEVGWHYQDVVKNLERKRKANARLLISHNKKLNVSFFFFVFILDFLLILFIFLYRNSLKQLKKRLSNQLSHSTKLSNRMDTNVNYVS